ncbi:hypothetical protein KSP40_PGU008281 [Platanthera guangdongensis]|uniref:Sec23/Sec24 helical domain-containing protein n=1 Tax=Platanthera guangdongensis TaxID=2320717 RepID=A0ABR2M968_9ASPA
MSSFLSTAATSTGSNKGHCNPSWDVRLERRQRSDEATNKARVATKGGEAGLQTKRNLHYAGFRGSKCHHACVHLHTEPPVLQIAFQYSIVVPTDETFDSISNSSASVDPETVFRPKFSLQRRLRIRTIQYSTAGGINEIYDSVDPETVLSILVHKVILASLEQGVREGRLLLHDWLVILTAQYNDVYKLANYDNGSSVSRVDISFSQCPQLQSIPRLVFAFLRNPLLRFHEEGVHPDYRIYLQCLFRYF